VQYVRGSHRWGTEYRPNLFVSAMAIPGTIGEDVPDVDALVAAGDCDVISFDTGPGDVVIHHARTLHAAGPNTSRTIRRRAISVRYCGDDARTLLRPGAPRKPHQEHWADGDLLDPDEHPRVWGVDS
jgi:ectoine hydroxylase-related dioxygenase (phytanoyl-CoA dioxygenase family)